jgi:Bacterial Ig-like domain (group 3)
VARYDFGRGWRAPLAGLAVVAVAATGCSGEDLTLPQDQAPGHIAIMAGDRQKGTAGAALADSVAVRVTDASDRPVQSAVVVFTAPDGGDVTPDTARTDANGRAASRWVLSPTAGVQRVQARVVGDGVPADLAVTFTASAEAGSPPPVGSARLSLAAQPSDSALRGVKFARQPRVRLQDASGGALHRQGVTVVAALASGTGQLGGTTNVTTGADGEADFRDLYITGDDGNYTLIFSAQGFESVTSSAIRLRTEGQAAVTVSITSHDPNPSDVGRAVTFKVSIAPTQGGATPEGSFRISTSTGDQCTGVTSKGSCEIVFNSPGDRTVTATWLGNATFGPAASQPVTHSVNEVAGATRTIIGTGPDPADAGQPVTIFVTVKGSGSTAPRGLVNLYLDGSACGEGTFLGGVELDDKGQGTRTVSTLPRGFREIRGCYTGAPGFAPSEDLASETIR